MRTLETITAELEAKYAELEAICGPAIHAGHDPHPDEMTKARPALMAATALEKELAAARLNLKQQQDNSFKNRLDNALAAEDDNEQKKAKSTSPYFGHVGAELAQHAAKTLLGADGRKSLDPSGSLDLRTSAIEVAATGRYTRFLAELAAGDPLEIDAGEFPMLRQTVRTNNAAPVAPGAQKPYSTHSVEQIIVPLRTIAHVSDPIERQLLEDHANLTQFVNEEMVYGVAQAIDAQIVSGNGTGQNLEGILNTSGVVQQAFATDAPTTLRKARTRLENIGKAVSSLAVAMNPDDVEALDLAEGSDGQFKNLASVEDDGIARVFGVRIVPNSGVPAGTAVMGDWSSARFHMRSRGVQIAWRETGTATYNAADTDLFEHNLVQVRAEVRCGLGLSKPGDFVIADLTA